MRANKSVVLGKGGVDEGAMRANKSVVLVKGGVEQTKGRCGTDGVQVQVHSYYNLFVLEYHHYIYLHTACH